MRSRISVVTVCVAALAAAAAHADVYKWVDQHGVTNYSAKPPANIKAAKKIDGVEQRVSVYTPDAALKVAMAADARGSDRILSNRIDNLERQLEAERRARLNAAAADFQASQTAYERCVAERRVDCNGGPYRPAMVIAYQRRQTPFVPMVPVSGATAGNITDAIAAAGNGVSRTPGAFSGSAFTVRSASVVPMRHGSSR